MHQNCLQQFNANGSRPKEVMDFTKVKDHKSIGCEQKKKNIIASQQV